MASAEAKPSYSMYVRCPSCATETSVGCSLRPTSGCKTVTVAALVLAACALTFVIGRLPLRAATLVATGGLGGFRYIVQEGVEPGCVSLGEDTIVEFPFVVGPWMRHARDPWEPDIGMERDDQLDERGWSTGTGAAQLVPGGTVNADRRPLFAEAIDGTLVGFVHFQN